VGRAFIGGAERRTRALSAPQRGPGPPSRTCKRRPHFHPLRRSGARIHGTDFVSWRARLARPVQVAGRGGLCRGRSRARVKAVFHEGGTLSMRALTEPGCEPGTWVGKAGRPAGGGGGWGEGGRGERHTFHRGAAATPACEAAAAKRCPAPMRQRAQARQGGRLHPGRRRAARGWRGRPVQAHEPTYSVQAHERWRL
jgi:hypothetical protein